MHDVLMPRLSDSMQEGTIIRWLKADGEKVRRGEELVEIETDKATMAYEAEAEGVVATVAAEGDVVPVGARIATIGAAVNGGVAAGAGVAAGGGVAVGGGGAAKRHGASPVARRTAARLGVDLASVVGTGAHGRILKSDVALAADRAPAAPAPAAAPAPVAAPAPQSGRGVTVEEPTRAQAVIARRMAESRATVPEFAIQVDVVMTDALALRARLKEIADPAPSLNDLIVKACAFTLQRHPRANGSYRDGRFELHDAVNIGVAVAAPDTLVVPVVRDADSKSLGAIAAESRRLAERVRSGEITPPELSGGTFTVSNLGMFGIDRFEGIIDVPQAAILCVGAVNERPIVRDGQVVPAPTMTLTLACDHRILYGADAAAFLRDVKRALEQPLSALL